MKRRADGRKSGAEITVVALCLVLLVFFVSRKEGFHMDELLSFELSNAEYNPWIVTTQPEGRLAKFIHNEIDADTLKETLGNLAAAVEDVVKNRGNSKLLTYKADVYEEPVWITGQQFRDYITVGEKDAFNYLSVYFNVKDDNHPPLHFMLLHTVSSIFRGRVFPWMGCAINLAAVAVVLVLLIKLGRMLAEALGMEGYSRLTGILCALLYGVSSGAVATVLLIRMYAMLTLWCVALLYLVLKKWRNRSFDRHNKGLIAVTVMGFWTQYFFLFYCMTLAAAVGVLLLSSKRFRELLRLLRSFVIAAVIGIAAFPFAIADVFSSGRGVEALENLSQGLRGYGERICVFAGILWERILSPGFWLLLVTGAVACLVLRLRQRAVIPAEAESGAAVRSETGASVRAGTGAALKEEDAAVGRTVAEAGERPQERAGRGAYAVLVLLPMAGYFLLAARMSPYLVDRYIMPLFPLAALACGVLLIYLLSCLSSFLRSENGQSASRSRGSGTGSGQGGGIGKDIDGEGSALKGSIRSRGSGKTGAWDVLQLCICVLAVLLQAAALAGYDGEYLYSGYQEQENVAAAHEGEACVCIYDGVGYYENLKEFTYYEKSLLLTAAELENRRDTGSIKELGQFVLLVKGGVRADEVLEVFAERYGFAPQEQVMLADSVHGDRIYVMMESATACPAQVRRE